MLEKTPILLIKDKDSFLMRMIQLLIIFAILFKIEQLIKTMIVKNINRN
jgi:hypothetical protein